MDKSYKKIIVKKAISLVHSADDLEFLLWHMRSYIDSSDRKLLTNKILEFTKNKENLIDWKAILTDKEYKELTVQFENKMKDPLKTTAPKSGKLTQRLNCIKAQFQKILVNASHLKKTICLPLKDNI